MADAFKVLQLVEKVHDTANCFAAHRGTNESGSVYIARVKVLGDLAELSDMDESELVKFKVLKRPFQSGLERKYCFSQI